MKKGNILLPLVFGIISAIVILLVGSYLLSTALNISDDEDLAVTSLRAIATSVSQAEPLDYCSSAEIKLTRAYMIKAEGNELKLYKQKLEKSNAGDIIGSEVIEVDSINLDMASDVELFCKKEYPGCSNSYSLADICMNPSGDNVVTTHNTKEKCEAQGKGYTWRDELIPYTELPTKPGLTINPDFSREIGDTFCVCNVGKDKALLRALAIPSIEHVLDYVIPVDVTVISPKGWTDLTCDNPVSQFQG